jgi:hypothetical protein
MKTIQKKKFPKKIIATAVLILVLVAGALIYVYAFNGNILGWKKAQNTSNGGNINYGPATSEQQQAGAKTKSGSNSDTTPTPTPIPGSNKKSVQLIITSANINGSMLHIAVQIDAVDSTGLCTLTLTSTGQSTVTKTANTQALASTSTCQGFDVPLSELPSGTWHILVEYSSSALSGSATQDKVID